MKLILHTGHTRPSCMCVIQEYQIMPWIQVITMNCCQYHDFMSIKGVPVQTRTPETLNCSKSKTCRAKKLKPYQPVYLISQTSWWSFSFLALHVLNLEQFKVSGGLVFLGHPLPWVQSFFEGGWGQTGWLMWQVGGSPEGEKREIQLTEKEITEIQKYKIHKSRNTS